jgi:hypothetical protein
MNQGTRSVFGDCRYEIEFWSPGSLCGVLGSEPLHLSWLSSISPPSSSCGCEDIYSIPKRRQPGFPSYSRGDCGRCPSSLTVWNLSQRGLGLNLFFFFLFLFLFFWDRVSLYSSGCPGTHFVDQTGLELRNPPVFDSQVLGLKACATTARQGLIFEQTYFARLLSQCIIEQ